MTLLTFPVRCREQVLIVPASLTLEETKRLSDIDSKESLSVLMPDIFIYRGGLARGGDPADVIRRAQSEVLVHSYLLAGRFREVEGGKLVVDCTGEGVVFTEADVDVRLVELVEVAAGSRGLLTPLFPCMDEILLDVESSNGVITWPLVVIQVTRLLCGSFVFAMRMNHAMCDAAGISPFMSAVADLARGLPAPAVTPSLSRQLLDAPLPRSDDHDAVPLRFPTHDDDEYMVMRSFIFGPTDVESLKKRLHGADAATTFEVLAALLWCSHTMALMLVSGEHAWLGIIASFRKNAALCLPVGYYDNACVPLRAFA